MLICELLPTWSPSKLPVVASVMLHDTPDNFLRQGLSGTFHFYLSRLTNLDKFGYPPQVVRSSVLTLFRVAFLGVLLVAAAVCSAKPPFLKVFLATYHVQPDSNLGKARCLICHQPPAPPIRNPYGRQVQMALLASGGRMVTPGILKSVEKQNIGDGVTNISKIKSDSLPGVVKAKAKPPSKAKKGKHRASKRKKPLASLPPASGAGLLLLSSVPLGCFLAVRSSKLSQE